MGMHETLKWVLIGWAGGMAISLFILRFLIFDYYGKWNPWGRWKEIIFFFVSERD